MASKPAVPGSKMPHGGFIPSIEGMRSLAVLVVLLFHLDIHVLGGGYLGVDLFFVISGFIITRNILFDMQAGKFSLKVFYIRRFRRLYPALLITVLLTLAVAVITVPPIELEQTAKSAIYTLFSLANFNFWLEAGYFDAAAQTKPLLHTWSLSVEEQFYLFWPAVLLMFATTRRRLVFSGSLLVLSLGSAYLLRDSIPSDVFYLLPYRAHQLMAGALVAILSLRLTDKLGDISTLVATAGFVGATVIMGDSISPMVGAAMVSGLGFLLLLGRDSGLAQLLYGNRPMQWIGKRSYALYLVHWPIIVLFKYFTDFQLDLAERGFLFLLTMAFTVALHELVEKPFRIKGEDTSFTKRIALPATVFTLLGTVFIASNFWGMNGLPSRVDPQIQQLIESVDQEKDLRDHAIRFGQCNLQQQLDFSDYDVGECAKIDPKLKNVLVIGDSMASDTYMMLSQTYDNIRFSQATAGACTAILNITDAGGNYPACLQLNALRFSELVELDMDLIVLASIWTEDRIQHLKDTVAYLRSRGKKVLVIGPRASFEDPIPFFISRQVSIDVLNRRLLGSIGRRTELLYKMRAAMPNVEIIDIGSIQCAPYCDVVDSERLLYFDSFHFTQLGAKQIGERFKQSFDLLDFINAPTIGSGHWFQVLLHGIRSNANGGKAIIRLTTNDGQTHTQVVDSYSENYSHNAHFELGPSTGITTLEVEWPDNGKIHRFTDLTVDQVFNINEADQTDMQFSIDNIIRGLYWDRAHSGHGFDLQRVGDKWLVLLYTFLPDKTPSWYMALGEIHDAVFTGTANQFDYEPDRSPPQREIPNSGGTINIDFAPGSSSRNRVCSDGVDRISALSKAAFEFDIGGHRGAWCVEPTHLTDGELTLDFTGQWFSSQDRGWGMTVITQGTDTQASMVVSLYYYDAYKQPRWALGSVSNVDLTDQVSVEMRQFTGYCLSCLPSALESTVVGHVDLTLGSPNDELDSGNSVDINVNFSGAPGGYWLKTGTSIQQLSDPAERELP